MFGTNDHYDSVIKRVGAQAVSQAVAASKRGDKLALARAGIQTSDKWSVAVLGLRSGIIIQREARAAEEAQRVKRRGYR